MRQPGSHELYAYWDQLRGSRAAPERADLDLAAIRTLLADIFILTVDPDRTYPFCLASPGLNALFDAQLRGRSFLSLWNRDQKREIASIVQTVTDDASPVIGGAEAAPRAYEKTAFELLLLPLRHNGKTHARILGRLAPARHPPWLGLSPVEALDFKSMRVLDTRDLTKTAFFAAASDGRSPEPSFEKRGHLRIYNGKKPESCFR